LNVLRNEELAPWSEKQRRCKHAFISPALLSYWLDWVVPSGFILRPRMILKALWVMKS